MLGMDYAAEAILETERAATLTDYGMSRYISVSMLVAWIFSSGAYIQAETLSFPGAEGFGRFAEGGRGGQVIEITTLSDSGSGSLRACVEASGPRTCVFRVGGSIHLQSPLVIKNPRITIAGQTAPGDGIMIRGSQFAIAAADVIVRFIRLRPGADATPQRGLIITTGAQDVIVDHCSFSWAYDDLTLAWGPSSNITLQWNIVAESFQKTLLISNGDKRISVHHNLLMSGLIRYPEIGHGHVDYVNNLINNFQLLSTTLVNPAFGPVQINVVNNYYRWGASTTADPDRPDKLIRFKGNQTYSGESTGYVSGNKAELPNGTVVDALPLFEIGITQVGSRHNFPLVTTTSASKAMIDVQAGAGARLPALDSIDTRILNEVANKTGQLIKHESEVGGYPVYRSGTPPLDSDHDGMPDGWEIDNGLNPSDPSDGAGDADGDGYTNLEEYLNSRTGVVGDTAPPARPGNLQIAG